ncbi:beta-N-acetylhexosaminidase [Gramella sp. AN32]|uniref:beta-N-acetylhexosaminidase n=1 Tax=Christiangramia antarctica TaxID=2058158 RepID=A0ABW5X8J2_9FLAO|nr:beta-N-acetylhexosaminidase [Gramella sp. AN32]MCM4156019.1 glycoside hydrolase family 20 [Gramella sp. AN32]
MKLLSNSRYKKMRLALLIFSFVIMNAHFILAQEKVQIIPQPSSIGYGNGTFVLKDKVTINASEGLQNEVQFLSALLQKGFSKTPKLVKKGIGILLKIDESLKDKLGEEGYTLSVGRKGIYITGATATGVFYGIESFRQLLPVDFEFEKTYKSVKIPFIEITDKPRFPWRAFMLDESRHFKGKEAVKNILDQMSMFKMNTFHWHLTDDQGWRIEIKKYPKLTEIGSKRRDTQLSRKSEERVGEPHEGFYTQSEIKEILAYAESKHINVVPEIEMPGHATAAIAAYPWLSSMGVPQEVSVTFGKLDDSFNIADPKVVTFLTDVLDEVIKLFPGEVIHIGGDEVNFKPWEDSRIAQDFMSKNGLETPIDLQIYFTNQISNYIDSSGKRMMGWNEIMGTDIHEDDGKTSAEAKQKLAKSAIVHFWKGDLKLINEAVEQGYDVVNSNHWDTYLDYTYERTPLSKSYAFNPVPEGLNKEYHYRILGTGAQMWSEWIPTVASMEQQVFPRLAAYAEVGWTTLENKDFERFENTLKLIKQRWKLMGISFYEGD